jgi:hypothetical protein
MVRNYSPRRSAYDTTTPKAWCGLMPSAEQELGRRSYYANVAFIDEWVGKVMAALAGSNFVENTFIIWSADHGDGQEDHFHWRKGFPYQFSANVPFILRWPEYACCLCYLCCCGCGCSCSCSCSCSCFCSCSCSCSSCLSVVRAQFSAAPFSRVHAHATLPLLLADPSDGVPLWAMALHDHPKVIHQRWAGGDGPRDCHH